MVRMMDKITLNYYDVFLSYLGTRVLRRIVVAIVEASVRGRLGASLVKKRIVGAQHAVFRAHVVLDFLLLHAYVFNVLTLILICSQKSVIILVNERYEI